MATPSDRREAADAAKESPDDVGSAPGGPITATSTNASTHADATPDHDRRLLAILDAPLLLGEPAAVGFARKERELSEAFAELPILAARALHKRLANPRHGDLLAEKFSRLTVERRNRLLLFLADARRRAAISNGRR